MSTATVRYRVAVYATVDTETGTVTKVFEDIESIRLDTDDEFVGFDLMPEQSMDIARDVIGEDFDDYVEPVLPLNLTPEIAQRVLDIAESAEWPAWES